MPPPPGPDAAPDDGHIVPLRPYGVGEMFVGAWRVLVRRPRPLLAVGVLGAAVQVGIRLAAGPGYSSSTAADQTTFRFDAGEFARGLVGT